MMSNVPMTLPGLMLAEHRTRFYHASTFAQLDDGRILHVAAEKATWSDDGGLTWSDITYIRDTNGREVGGSGTSLVRLSGRDEVGLAAQAPQGAFESPGAWARGTPVAFWRSRDGGQTWDPPIQITPWSTIPCGHHPNCMIRTASGRIVLPVNIALGQGRASNDPPLRMVGKLVNGHWVSTAAHFFGGAMMACSAWYCDDDGQTWQHQHSGELLGCVNWDSHSRSVSYTCEPTVTEVRPGTLLMFMRTGLGRLFQSWSYDNGESWTRPMPTALAAQTSPAAIATLATGHLLCVWNQESADEIRRGYNRTRLSSAISRDGGRVWEFFQNVESMHETTRVEPGPIEAVHPQEVYTPAGRPAFERDGRFIAIADEHYRFSYPSVGVFDDRVIIAYPYTTYEPHPNEARLVMNKHDTRGFNQKQKVLPLHWFYGGKEPADNPFLPRAYDPARP